MFLKKIITIVVLVFLLNLSAVAQINQTQDSSHVNPEQLQLPENVRTDLLREMTNLTMLMGDLLEYIVQGDATHTVWIAVEIRDNNFRQRSNSKELKHIMTFLPKGYIKLNREFHSTAHELVQAVDTSDFKTAIGLYSEMTQGCFNCHVTYAKKRFPNLESEK